MKYAKKSRPIDPAGKEGGMTPKERVNTAIEHREPDRVPVFITVTPQVAESLARKLGIEGYTHADSPLSENRISFTELLVELGNDMVGIGACAPRAHPTREEESGVLVDEWGLRFRRAGYYAEMISHPLANAETIADVEHFAFPDPDAPGRFDLARRTVERYGERYAVIGDAETTVFEVAWYLVGMEKFLVDLLQGREYVFALLDRVTGYSLGVARNLIRLGAEIIWLGDDFGTQSGMLVSPRLWREVFKERMRRIVRTLKEQSPGTRIAYHCCGSYAAIIPDLLEIGIDLLNALQPTARDMDLRELKRAYGDRATFFGGIDTQSKVPFGSLDDLEHEVERVIASAAHGGGYILAGAHNLQPDTSAEKVVKLFQYAREHGRYPLAGKGGDAG
jgi:uroporphyrinogen decarboxylase